MAYIGSKAADVPNKGLNKSNNLSDLLDKISARNNLSSPSKVDTRRNLITNPCMQLSQENGDTAGTTAAYYPADEWWMDLATSAGVVSGQRIQSTTLAGALDRARISVTTADTSLAAGEYLALVHKIEGVKLAAAQFGTANAKDLVVRFMGNFPTGTYAIALRNAANNRSFVREFTAAAGVDTVYEFTFPGDTSGTWPTGEVSGANLYITFASGSTFQTTKDAWQAGNYIGTSSISNGLGAVQSFDIGDVGLRLDPDSTGVYGEFEVPDYAENERACMRYYINKTASTHWVTMSTATPIYTETHMAHPVTMRTTPSVTTAGTHTTSGLSIQVITSGPYGLTIRANAGGAHTPSDHYITYKASARM